MSGTVTFKCPSCGAYLEFEPGAQQFSCPYCLQTFTEEEMRGLARGGQDSQPAAAPDHLRGYHCQACGAEIVTGDTTAATRCYYCHSPVGLSDRLDGSFRPDGVLPFRIGREEALTRDDLVMAVKNNYHWTERAAKGLGPGERLPMDFIANGDAARVVRIRNEHRQHGFTFADATLRFPEPDDSDLESSVLLSTLTSESPSLTREESQRLFEAVAADYAHIPLKRDRMKAVREDSYYNALQLKYAYAVTCHKAQGGQWERVYVDQGFVPDEAMGAPYLRWLYPALTRTTERAYLVNWPAEG